MGLFTPIQWYGRARGAVYGVWKSNASAANLSVCTNTWGVSHHLCLSAVMSSGIWRAAQRGAPFSPLGIPQLYSPWCGNFTLLSSPAWSPPVFPTSPPHLTSPHLLPGLQNMMFSLLTLNWTIQENVRRGKICHSSHSFCRAFYVCMNVCFLSVCLYLVWRHASSSFLSQLFVGATSFWFCEFVDPVACICKCISSSYIWPSI